MTDLLSKARTGRVAALEHRTRPDTGMDRVAFIRDAVQRCVSARGVATAAVQSASVMFQSRRGMMAA